MPLHDTGEALALRDADHVDVLAGREPIDRDGRADFVRRRVVRSHLDEVLGRSDAAFREVTLHRLADARLFDLAEAELHGRVPVPLRGSDLRDDARPRLHDGDRDRPAFIGEDLGHAQLLAQDRFHVGHQSLISM